MDRQVTQDERSTVLFDSLPYIDTAYTDDGVRRQVEQLIQAEMRTFQPDPAHYLRHLPPVPSFSFESPSLLNAEFARMAQQGSFPRLDMSRYEVAEPATLSADTYEQAVTRASSLLEYQKLRSVNAELLQKFGPNAWRIYNTNYDVLAKKLQEEIERVKAETEELNRARKRDQMNVAGAFRNLDTQYYELVQKATDLSGVLASLEAEVEDLRSRKRKATGDGTHDNGKKQQVEDQAA